MSNGLAESQVRKVKRHIATVAHDHPQVAWHHFLPFVLAAIRNTVNAATQIPPFEMLYGRHMKLPVDSQLTSSRYSLSKNNTDSNLAIWSTVWNHAKTNIEDYQQETKFRADKTARPQNFQVGQQVYLKEMAFQPKFSILYQPKYSGPYEIIEISGVNAVLEKLNHPGETQKVHFDRLKLNKTEVTEKCDSKLGVKARDQKAEEPIEHTYNTRSKAKGSLQ